MATKLILEYETTEGDRREELDDREDVIQRTRVRAKDERWISWQLWEGIWEDSPVPGASGWMADYDSLIASDATDQRCSCTDDGTYKCSSWPECPKGHIPEV